MIPYGRYSTHLEHDKYWHKILSDNQTRVFTLSIPQIYQLHLNQNDWNTKDLPF